MAPNGIISEADPAFSWQEAVDAAEYQLVVKKADGSAVFENGTPEMRYASPLAAA